LPKTGIVNGWCKHFHFLFLNHVQTWESR
jgi:hypothetical protein